MNAPVVAGNAGGVGDAGRIAGDAGRDWGGVHLASRLEAKWTVAGAVSVADACGCCW